jgi:hypothetical protein
MRSVSATEIQRWWRGERSRHLLSDNSPGRVLLTWRWGCKRDVLVAGEFSDWRPQRMTYCPITRDHRLSVPITHMDSRGSFMYKFIVDGLWTCDGSLPMASDNSSNLNNVYVTSRPPQETPAQTERQLSRYSSTTTSSSFPRIIVNEAVNTLKIQGHRRPLRKLATAPEVGFPNQPAQVVPTCMARRLVHGLPEISSR